MYNLSKYLVIIILSIIICLCNNKLIYNTSLYNQFFLIFIVCCIIDLVYNKINVMKEHYDYQDNNNKQSKPDFRAGSPNSIFVPSNEDINMFGNINKPSANSQNTPSLNKIFGKNNYNSHSNLQKEPSINSSNHNIFNGVNSKPNINHSNNTNSFNNIIENLKNGLNELDNINNNNCIKVIDNFKNKIKYLNHIIGDINNDLHTQVFNNQKIPINEERHNVCPILLENNYSSLN